MKSRTTLILVVLAALVGLVVVWDHYKGIPTDVAAEKGKRILGFKSEDVTRLELARTNQTIVVEKSGEKWDIKQPLAVRADGGMVNSILSDLEFAQRDRALSEKDLQGANLADFGLDQPSVRVTLHSKKGPITLLVGRETATKDAVYVQVEGRRRVDIAPKSILDRLNTSLENLRSHVAIEFTPAAATRLELKSVDRVIELARAAAKTNAEPRWAIIRPLAARAAQRKVSELLTALGSLRIQDFVSEDPKDVHTYQLEDPQREVTVWTGDAGTTLLIGRSPTNDPTKVYAKLKSADSIFTVSADEARRFAPQINELRDPQVLAFSQPDVWGLELLRGAEKTVLARTNIGWNITSPGALAAEDGEVAALLEKLGDLEVVQFAADVATDLDKYGLAAPTATLTLLGKGTNVLAQLLVGNRDETNSLQYVKRGDEPFIYSVDTNIVGWMPTGPLSLRARRVAELKAEQITKLAVRKTGEPVVVERGSDGKWKLTEPPQGVLDNDALNQLLDDLAQLRAVKFIQQGRDDLAEYGLDAPAFTVTAWVGDKNYDLAVGKPEGNGLQYALWSDPPLVFTVEPAALAPMTKQIVTTAAPMESGAPTNTAPSGATATPPPGVESPTSAPASASAPP